MLTPNDILNATFNRSFRGFDVDEVRDFLCDVSESTYKLIKENGDLKAVIEDLNKQIDELSQKPKEFAAEKEIEHKIKTPSESPVESRIQSDEQTALYEKLVKQNSELDIIIHEKETRLEDISQKGIFMVREIKNMLDKHIAICHSLEENE